MKTEKETSVLEEKKAMIQELIGIIDKNTSSKNDVWYLVKGIKEFSEFFAEQRLLHNAQIFKESRVIMSQISKSGYKLGYIAERLSITNQGLYNKLRGKSEFTHTEICTLSEILGENEVNKIFFAQKSELDSTISN